MTSHRPASHRAPSVAADPTAYATTPAVHWRRALMGAAGAGLDLDLTLAPARATDIPSGSLGTTIRQALPGSQAPRNWRAAPLGPAGSESGGPEAAGTIMAGEADLRAGLGAALGRCQRDSSGGALIHLRLDALPRWLDLARDPAAATTGPAPDLAAGIADGGGAAPLLAGISRHLLDMLPPQSLLRLEPSGQAWIVIEPVVSGAAALAWARHALHNLSTAGRPSHGGTSPRAESSAWALEDLALDVSAGLCLFPADAGDVDALLIAASSASALARESGPGHCQLYSHEVALRSRDSLQEGLALGAALRSRGLELSLQGHAGVVNGALSGAQVQLSWPRRSGDQADQPRRPAGAAGTPARPERRAGKQPGHGLTGDALVALARRHGLAEAYGRELLLRTLRQLRRWRSDDVGVPRLTLRLPVEMIKRSDFAIELLDLLGRHQLTGHCLALELGPDELAALRDDTAHLLDGAGVTLVADAAQVSLAALTTCQHLPVSALVIDLAQLGDITVSLGPARATLFSLAQLAHGMGMRLIARSVDREAELEVLTRIGCDDYLGAVLARPLPARIWSRLLAEEAAPGQGPDPAGASTPVRPRSAVSA